jgi:primase-polymerase (primpol)-like protein
LPEAGRRNAAIEIYSNKRFMTVTGDRVPGFSDAIEHRDKELLALYTSCFSEHVRKTGPSCPQDARSRFRSSPGYPGNLSDDDLLDRARRARNGALFRSLFDDGSLAGYRSDSEADLTLCLILAFWTGRDRERMDRLFRQSARMRDKKWNREDYRNDTLDKAVQRVQATWKPRS